jgi:hypothetical protein
MSIHSTVICDTDQSIGCPTSSVAQANLTIKTNFNILRSLSSSEKLTIYLHAFLQSFHPFEKNCGQGLPRDFRQNNPNTNKKFRCNFSAIQSYVWKMRYVKAFYGKWGVSELFVESEVCQSFCWKSAVSKCALLWRGQKGKSPRVLNLANRADEVPVSFDWDRCNPLPFSRCVVKHYQNTLTTCLAVFPQFAASNLRLRPRCHLYNIV